MGAEAEELKVDNNEAERRFEVTSGGVLGVLQYEQTGERLALTHTEVAPELEGRGIAGKLARAALEHAREQGLKVVPACSFVAAYIRRHREYEPLVADE